MSDLSAKVGVLYAFPDTRHEAFLCIVSDEELENISSVLPSTLDLSLSKPSLPRLERRRQVLEDEDDDDDDERPLLEVREKTTFLGRASILPKVVRSDNNHYMLECLINLFISSLYSNLTINTKNKG